MSRIRSIKPEFWTDEAVMECSIATRLLFIGLWNFCDDAGRHPLSPKQVKALVFPSDDMPAESVRGMLDELSTNGLIKIYVVDNKEYFEITGWRHQKIDRPQSPKYPAPFDELSTNARDGEDEGEEGKGEEDTKPNGLDGPEPSKVVPLDARTILFTEGLSQLKAISGRPDSQCRALLGKWLKASHDDANTVQAAILRAVEVRPADLVPWIERALKPDPDAEIYRFVSY